MQVGQSLKRNQWQACGTRTPRETHMLGNTPVFHGSDGAKTLSGSPQDGAKVEAFQVTASRFGWIRKPVKLGQGWGRGCSAWSKATLIQLWLFHVAEARRMFSETKKEKLHRRVYLNSNYTWSWDREMEEEGETGRGWGWRRERKHKYQRWRETLIQFQTD